MALRLPLALACAFLAASPVLAETVDVRAGRLIDPETGEVRSDQRIRIVDGKIAGISPWQADGGPATVDWSGFNVLPGLIDLHMQALRPAMDPMTMTCDALAMSYATAGYSNFGTDLAHAAYDPFDLAHLASTVAPGVVCARTSSQSSA